MEQQRPEISLADPIEEIRPVEKNHDTTASETIVNDEIPHNWHSHVRRRLAGYMKRFEKQLLEYNIEARGIQRVEEQERHALTWMTYLQVFLLWVSINLAANNITLGMLGPAVYGLSFLDSSLCSIFGAFVGSLAAAWSATWGPISGNRTLVFGRYAMGWWPSKIIVLLNIVQMIGYGLIDCVVGGQILSAVSPNYHMSVAVGIVVVAVITWFIATFGIKFFHYYERYAFLPQVIVVCILYGVSAKKYDLETPSAGDSLTVTGNRLSFFSICLSAAITYAPLAADFFVYYPPATPKVVSFGLTFIGLILSFTMAFVVGIGLASGIATDTAYSDAYNAGAGALIVEGFSPVGGFGKFCSVLVALGLISNTIPPTYSSGIDFQILGRYAEMVPRIVWNTIAVIIYTVCALAGQGHLSEIFTNFLALMGYWVAIWFAILLEERYIFRRQTGYNWAAWDDPSKLPIGLAAFTAFLVGWAGAVICMAQVWYIGPLAKLVGDYGADMGNYVGFSWAALVYPPLRYLELRYFGR
ncbi:nucleoside transporter, putative [Talaromyces stipitatus ATCC 10500]|uniref:Nucleoside transporter, putative n=1 Tax=Talaromyces stipitatus (strain ATCC 10500 / CBS 375.48 / QM 6759 / NRRL 1006) TaxID=441959 RepID=B8MEH0_TALSN|nr:nucleoside transporter, putative [Talaromyces stipitatus ATCC 10500]XP_002483831.1 nucleoside transporter, putative [Talaromyces stipitatus ATCC 10500]EED16596.1 nucleoside transporter, putative [Talaromyces stipitatus ATCC 10500]EED16597.1 nucleoside transporter, putative [Talaromyces stipitatus ATCC 10500]